MVSTEVIKELREKTGVSVMQCKKALDDVGGDIEKALEVLKEQSKAIAEKKSERKIGAGVIASYIHATETVGAMVQLVCETDFVAKNEDFKKLAHNVAMQVAAMNPEDKESLLNQDFIKEPGNTIKDLIESATQKFGERIEIGEISRLSI